MNKLKPDEWERFAGLPLLVKICVVRDILNGADPRRALREWLTFSLVTA